MLTNLHGITERARKVYGLPTNPSPASSARHNADLDFYSPGEVDALVRAADGEQGRSPACAARARKS